MVSLALFQELIVGRFLDRFEITLGLNLVIEIVDADKFLDSLIFIV